MMRDQSVNKRFDRESLTKVGSIFTKVGSLQLILLQATEVEEISAIPALTIRPLVHRLRFRKLKAFHQTFDEQKGKIMKASEHLIAERLTYDHHGIYLGQNRVIHYSGKFDVGEVSICSLKDFSSNAKIRIKPFDEGAFPADEILLRAYSRLGERDYNLLFNNCEHFVNWCIYDDARSSQVNSILAPPTRRILETILTPSLTSASAQSMLVPVVTSLVMQSISPLPITASTLTRIYDGFRTLWDD